MGNYGSFLVLGFASVISLITGNKLANYEIKTLGSLLLSCYMLGAFLVVDSIRKFLTIISLLAFPIAIIVALVFVGWLS